MPQPTATPETTVLKELIADHLHLEGPMLPILHSIQHSYGCIPDEAVPLLADALNITRAEVHGVISFYHDFRANPAGKHVLKICRAEACQAMGGNAVAERLLSKLGLNWNETTADGMLTVEPVYCLGLCSVAPAAMLDDQLIARADAARIGEALEGCA